METTNKSTISASRRLLCLLTMISIAIIGMATPSDMYIHAAIENLQSQLESLRDFKVARVEAFDIDKDVIAVVFFQDDDVGSFSEKDSIFSFFPDSYAEINNRLYFWTSDEGHEGNDLLIEKLKEYGIVDESKGTTVVCGWGDLPIYLMRKDDISLYIFMIGDINHIKRKTISRLKRTKSSKNTTSGF